MGRLEAKIALITGAGRGIGKAIAQRFHDEGARVIINDIDSATSEEVAGALNGTAIVADVADSSAVQRMFKEVRQRSERLDILVNNAGTGISRTEEERQAIAAVWAQQAQDRADGRPITAHLDATVNLSDQDWHKMIAVHLYGTFYCTREALKIMNPQLSGCIINMSSTMGTSGGAAGTHCSAAHYSAAKGGILSFTRDVARDVVTRNIRVNAIAPGFIETDMTASMGPMRSFTESQTPMGHYGTPDDIAWAAVYLVSDEARFITGQVLSPNGGYYMSQ